MNIRIKVLSLLTFSLFMSCSNSYRIFESKNQDTRIEIRKGYFRGVEYFVVKKKVKKNMEFELMFDCECPEWKQGLSKTYKNLYWKAVTDTIPRIVFFDTDLNENTLVKPMSFLPITKEDLLLLDKGINESGKGCCYNKEKPIGKIIGFVLTTLPVK